MSVGGFHRVEGEMLRGLIVSVGHGRTACGVMPGKSVFQVSRGEVLFVEGCSRRGTKNATALCSRR